VDVSIVIVTRNTCELTRVALRSVFESESRLTNGVIVVDNGSADDTPKMVALEFPSAKYIRAEKNLGFARANNLGARACDGDFLLLLNSDARLETNSLAIAVEWMRQHPECGVAGAQLLNPDGSRQNSIANFPTLATELLNKSMLRRMFPRRFPGKEQVFNGPIEVESVVGAFMLIRRKVWEDVGGFDERYFFFLEETDFCLEARRRGWKVFHLPQVRICHAQGQSARQQPAAARIEYWRSRYAYFRKHHSLASQRVLVAGLRARLLLGWAASVLGLGLCLGLGTKLRQRYRLQTALLKWHFVGQPAEWGLSK
jgi:GT2 family glycosyltransferase